MAVDEDRTFCLVGAIAGDNDGGKRKMGLPGLGA